MHEFGYGNQFAGAEFWSIMNVRADFGKRTVREIMGSRPTHE